MANIKSAKKRINTNSRQKGENKYVKSTISTYIKGFRKLIAEGNLTEAQNKLPEVVSYINSACSKGVLHKNNASRKIARLSYALAKAQSLNATAPKEEVKEVKKEEVVEVKEEVKAPAKKATTTKKTTTKKTADKEEKPAKTTAKKITAKKETK